jgi:hypothetical protein
MPLGHYLSVGKLELGSALSESAERDKSLALMSRRSARRLRLLRADFAYRVSSYSTGFYSRLRASMSYSLYAESLP